MAETAAPERAPDKPTDLSKRTWKDTLKRTCASSRRTTSRCWRPRSPTTAAVALPRADRLLSLLGLAGTSTIDTLLENIGTLTPGAARDVVTNAVRDLQGSNSTAGFAFVAAWPARSGRPRATSAAHEGGQRHLRGRGGAQFWKLKPLQLL